MEGRRDKGMEGQMDEGRNKGEKCTFRVGCLTESWMVLPVASTVLPASSRMRGVGLEGAWNLVCEEERGIHFTGSMLHYQHWAVVNTLLIHIAKLTYLRASLGQKAAVCVSMRKSHSGKIKDSK